MKTHIDIKINKFYFDFGWFPNEDFKLFNIILLEIRQDMLIVFGLQIAKFFIGFGFYSN
jgi:hypothetical protein